MSTGALYIAHNGDGYVEELLYMTDLFCRRLIPIQPIIKTASFVDTGAHREIERLQEIRPEWNYEVVCPHIQNLMKWRKSVVDALSAHRMRSLL
jgi:hypothetical protein